MSIKLPIREARKIGRLFSSGKENTLLALQLLKGQVKREVSSPELLGFIVSNFDYENHINLLKSSEETKQSTAFYQIGSYEIIFIFSFKNVESHKISKSIHIIRIYKTFDVEVAFVSTKLDSLTSLRYRVKRKLEAYFKHKYREEMH